MILIYKNRGILIPVYLIASMLATFLTKAVLNNYIGGFFSTINLHHAFGVGLIIPAIWTYLVRHDYYRDNEGKKVIMDTENSFFFISIDLWSRIFFITGILFLLKDLF